MAESDFNMIKPIEGLQNISGITPANRRRERKKKGEDSSNHGSAQQNSDTIETDLIEDEDIIEENSLAIDKDDNTGRIDYCA